MEFISILEGTTAIDAHLKRRIEMIAKIYSWELGEIENQCIDSHLTRIGQKDLNSRISVQKLQDFMELNVYDFRLLG